MSPTTEVTRVSSSLDDQVRLQELEMTARSEYSNVLRAGRDAIEHAISCGEALNEARRLLPDGRWTAWVRETLQISHGTVLAYMRLAMHRELILNQEGIEGIGAALRVLRDEHLFPARPITDADRLRMRELRADHTLKQIAEMYDVTESTVHRWTSGSASASKRELQPGRQVRVPITDEMVERMALWISRNLYGGKLELNDGLRGLALKALQSVLIGDRRLR